MRPETTIYIFDGGLGTSLEDKYGVRFSSKKTPLWSSHMLVANQQTLLDCQADFGNVPVDIIGTATYQVSIDGFARTKTENWPRGVSIANIPTFLQDAVLIAAEAGGGCDVALSLGPYGATMVPSTEYSAAYDPEHASTEALASWHLERLSLFLKAEGIMPRISYMAFETVPRVDEIVAIRTMMGSPEVQSMLTGLSGGLGGLSGRRPYWISCVYPRPDDNLADGSSIREVVHALLSEEISSVVPWGIGINCTKVQKLDSLLRKYEQAVAAEVELNALQEWPSLILYPDGTNGEVYDTNTQTWVLPEGTRIPRESWEEQLAVVVNATSWRGKWKSIVVGGCCKSNHEDIARLRELLGKADAPWTAPNYGNGV